MGLGESLLKANGSMPPVVSMLDPIKRNPIVQNVVKNMGDVWDFAQGKTELFPSAPVAGYMAGERKPVGAKPGVMDQVFDMVNPMGKVAGIGATVFHGSPHKWSQVDLGQVGSGEGASMYGHGFYTAGARDTANIYREALSKGADVTHSLDLQRVAEDIGVPGYSVRSAIQRVQNVGGVKEAKAQIDGLPTRLKEQAVLQERSFLDKYGDQLEVTNVDKGHLYELDLPDTTIDKMLDWDKELKDQSGETLDKIKRAWNRVYDEPFNNGLSGAEFYDDLVEASGSKEGASAFLRRMGIPGIKYLDQGSRSVKSGPRTSNYVVFSEKSIKPLTRNGEKL